MFRGSLCASLLALAIVAHGAPPSFVTHTVASDIRGGYQVLAADLNRDGNPDLVALGSQMAELIWFENPGWERHVITKSAPAMINTDAADIDGDGIPELALAYGFSIVPSQSVGRIGILKNNGDPRQLWTLKEVDAIPTSHRVRWADVEGNGKKVLVDAPILNAKASGFADPEQLVTPLVFYRPGEWKRETITMENRGVVHGLLAFDWNGDGRDVVLTSGKFGVFLHSLGRDGTWSRREIVKGDPAPYPDGGASDVAVGRLKNRRLIATIEPFHGNRVIAYVEDDRGEWHRTIIDEELSNGHSLMVADFDGDGNDEIVAGGTRGARNVYLYRADDERGENWQRLTLDGNMAANSCVPADLNGDGRPDIACIDAASPSTLKWYENEN